MSSARGRSNKYKIHKRALHKPSKDVSERNRKEIAEQENVSSHWLYAQTIDIDRTIQLLTEVMVFDCTE